MIHVGATKLKRGDTTYVPLEYQCYITLVNEGVLHRKI